MEHLPCNNRIDDNDHVRCGTCINCLEHRANVKYRAAQFQKAEAAHIAGYPYNMKISGMNALSITKEDFEAIRELLTKD